MMFMKVFYILFLFVRLTLGIGNLMSSHSLSAGHVLLGLGRDIFCISIFRLLSWII